MASPPFPLAEAVVDPRVGDHGPALLALEDGSVFPGLAWGAPIAVGGDLVVNTSQTGYQEIATDPSYAGQVVVMTYPLIGNHGRLQDDDQSERPWLRALVVAHATAAVVDDARQLAALLRDQGIPAIAGVDTRALARHLREAGSLRGIVTAPGETDATEAVSRARAIRRWEDQDFVELVSPVEPRDVGEPAQGGPLVAIVDFGLKANIVRSLRRRGARVRILPHTVRPEVAPSRPRSTASSSPQDPATRRVSTAPWPWRAPPSPTVGHSWGSALATRSWPVPPEPRPAASASAITRPTTPCRTSNRDWSRSPPKTTR